MIKRPGAILIALLISFTSYSKQLLTPIEYLSTSGAQDLTPFTIKNDVYIAAAQLATDIPGQSASIEGGNADTDVIIYKKQDEHYIEYQHIPGHGNSGATFFTIGQESYLAIAGIKSGPHPPFNSSTYSMLYRWDGHFFYPIQQFFTNAARQWHYFNIRDRHFLAVAGGQINQKNKYPVSKINSMIYEWDGKAFKPFQVIDSRSGSAFKSFNINRETYLAFADKDKYSTLYRWDGTQFRKHQSFKGDGGRAFEFFTIANNPFLAYANSESDSIIYHWNGNKFTEYQVLKGRGGRNFAYLSLENKHYLFRVNHMLDVEGKHIAAIDSPLYQWYENQFVQVQSLPTYGAVSARIFEQDGLYYMTLANSLAADLSFKVNSVIYKISQAPVVEYG